MKVISLGAGVQSSAMLLMALDGRFGEKPHEAWFADTGAEPLYVYAWLLQLAQLVKPFPIRTLKHGDLVEELLQLDRRVASIPAYVTGNGANGGMLRRQCTSEYKLKAIYKAARDSGEPVEMWIGISLDEAHRCKPSQVSYITNRFPLLELNVTWNECETYLESRVGYAPGKSACTFCPYHSDAYWIWLKKTHPRDFQTACLMDEHIRHLPKVKGEAFVHRSLKPLRQVEFKHEHQGAMFMDAFGNECDGLCGL